MKPTIKDVANLAKVSTATVSKVINDTGSISQSTRSRVQKAIQQLDYHPNAFGRGLVSRRTDTIGFLLDKSPATLLSNPFYSRVLEGIERKLVDAGKNLLIGSYPSFTAYHSLPGFIRSNLVEGVILAGQFSAGFVSSLKKANVSTVLVDYHHPDIHLPVIHTDNTSGVTQAMDHLYSLGHRNFGFLRGNTTHPSVTERYESFKSFLKFHQLALHPNWITSGELEAEGGRKAIREILSHNSLPTAIMCTNDMMAIGAMSVLVDHGLRIPEDISIVGFDDTYLAQHTVPKLTSVHVEKELMGEKAVEILLQMLAGHSSNEQEKTMPVTLVARQSSGVCRLDPTQD